MEARTVLNGYRRLAEEGIVGTGGGLQPSNSLAEIGRSGKNVRKLALPLFLMIGFFGLVGPVHSVASDQSPRDLNQEGIVIDGGTGDRIQDFLGQKRLRLINLKEIEEFLVPIPEGEDASGYDETAVSEYRRFKKHVDGKSDRTRIRNAVASKTADFAIIPCDLDGDRIRDFVVQARARNKQFASFFFPGSGTAPILPFLDGENVVRMHAKPTDNLVWVGFAPESDFSGFMALFEGKIESVEPDPFDPMDGSLNCGISSFRISAESIGKTWTRLRLTDREGKEKPRFIIIPTDVFRETGFIRGSDAKTWWRVPEPDRNGIPGEVLAGGFQVRIIELRDGYLKIENPFLDSEKKGSPRFLWVLESDVSGLDG
jgi:hypothetical protein